MEPAEFSSSRALVAKLLRTGVTEHDVQMPGNAKAIGKEALDTADPKLQKQISAVNSGEKDIKTAFDPADRVSQRTRHANREETRETNQSRRRSRSPGRNSAPEDRSLDQHLENIEMIARREAARIESTGAVEKWQRNILRGAYRQLGEATEVIANLTAPLTEMQQGLVEEVQKAMDRLGRALEEHGCEEGRKGGH